MISIRKRWPILTAVAAAGAYGFNHYQIAGIENLRLERKAAAPPASQNMLGYADAFPANSLASGGYRNDQFWDTSGNFSGSLPSTGGVGSSQLAWQDTPGLSDGLSVGEKLAILQDSQKDQATASGRVSPFGETALSATMPSPIPAPPGLSTANDFAASNGNANVFRPASPSDVLPGTSFDASNLAAAGSIPDSLLSPRGELLPEGLNANFPTSTSSTPLPGGAGRKIRIASFNLQSLGPTKLAKPQVIELLVRILRQYDIVALQEIRSTRDDLLPMLVERLNQSGRTYDYIVGPRVGRTDMYDQYAYLFDVNSVETDRYQLYTVDDPQDLITYEPLVAWFRCKQVPVNQAFTFSLVNTRINPAMRAEELSILPQLISAVERDGRGEDDWIMVGDLTAGNSELQMFDPSTVRFAIRDIPTDVEGTKMLDSIFFSTVATTEYTGRSGAFDFLRKFNLSLERALEISDHMPVWAEFSAMEGAMPGRVAPNGPIF